MVEYIRQIVKQLYDQTINSDAEVTRSLLEATVEEINRLDPRDFLPIAQSEFTFARAALRRCSARAGLRTNFDEIQGICKALLRMLNYYGGEGSRATTRSFSFITDLKLRVIIERDYRELALTLLPSGAWKSTVVIGGSILEAVLYDALSKDPTTVAAAMATTHAPKKKLDDWTLHQLIEAAGALGIIPRESLNVVDQCLRDYRNYVHPKAEIRTGYPCTEAEAFMAKGALDSVLNHLA